MCMLKSNVAVILVHVANCYLAATTTDSSTSTDNTSKEDIVIISSVTTGTTRESLTSQSTDDKNKDSQQDDANKHSNVIIALSVIVVITILIILGLVIYRFCLKKIRSRRSVYSESVYEYMPEYPEYETLPNDRDSTASAQNRTNLVTEHGTAGMNGKKCAEVEDEYLTPSPVTRGNEYSNIRTVPLRIAEEDNYSYVAA